MGFEYKFTVYTTEPLGATLKGEGLIPLSVRKGNFLPFYNPDVSIELELKCLNRGTSKEQMVRAVCFRKLQTKQNELGYEWEFNKVIYY